MTALPCRRLLYRPFVVLRAVPPAVGTTPLPLARVGVALGDANPGLVEVKSGRPATVIGTDAPHSVVEAQFDVPAGVVDPSNANAVTDALDALGNVKFACAGWLSSANAATVPRSFFFMAH